MKLRPEDLTDEMIREERRLANVPSDDGETDDAMAAYCSMALGIRATAYQQSNAKRMIVDAINARVVARCPGRKHQRHVLAVCEGECCTSCGGPIDESSECRCDDAP